MRPLLFLLSHTFVNTIRRMVSSPKRLISLVFVISYYFWIFVRPWGASAMRSGKDPTGGGIFHIDFPPVQILDAILFAAFLVLSLPLLMQMAAYNRTMRAADVDVLFPTPVSPKLVMTLRVLRDYLATMILPLIILIFGWRPTKVSGIFSNMPHPETAGYIFRTATLAWLLLAMVWTVYGYAATLFVNRSDLASDRNAKVMKRGITFVVLATLIYVAVGFRMGGANLRTALHLADSFVLRVPFFLAHLGAVFALGPVTGIWHSFASGSALVALLSLGFVLALSEVGWMYDQAAVRGFETIESMRLRRGGDSFAILADAARRGKLKTGRQSWLNRMRVRPGAAMIWREAVIQVRTFRTSMIVILIIAVAYSLIPVFIFRSKANEGDTPASQIGLIFLACQGFGLFLYVLTTASTGYVELLRRIDLMKPLPFTPARLMTVEVLAKTYLPMFMSIGCTVIATVVCPVLWPYAIAHLMYGPSLALMLSSVILVVTLLFPEIDDPTQRGFRGMVQLLGVAIAITPGVVAFAIATYFAHSPILGGFLGMGFNLGVTLALTLAAGYLYLGFNPTE